MRDPILITGCARSGSSMTAAIIHGCGGFGGRFSMRGSHGSSRLSFENTGIRDFLVRPYFVFNGADPSGQDPLLPADLPCRLSSLRGLARNYIQRDGYVGGPWFYKDIRLCLMWREWHVAFPNAKWIIVRRSDSGIINSCMHTGYMRAYRDHAGWQGWVDQYKQRFDEMKEHPGMDVQEVWPTKFIEGDTSEIEQVVTSVGLEWIVQGRPAPCQTVPADQGSHS